MSYTILIKKDGWESLLEIKIQDEVLKQNPSVLSLIQDCFDKVFQYIREQKHEDLEEVDFEDE